VLSHDFPLHAAKIYIERGSEPTPTNLDFSYAGFRPERDAGISLIYLTDYTFIFFDKKYVMQDFKIELCDAFYNLSDRFACWIIE
jgi:hypothetical protein